MSAPLGYDPQHQAFHALRKRSGEGDGGATARRAADERHPLEFELVEECAQRCDFSVEVQIRLAHHAVRHTDAEPVVADQCVAVCDCVPEPPKVRALPVKFEVAHPPRRSDERWTIPTNLVGQASTAMGKEPDLRLPQHRVSLQRRRRQVQAPVCESASPRLSGALVFVLQLVVALARADVVVGEEAVVFDDALQGGDPMVVVLPGARWLRPAFSHASIARISSPWKSSQL